MNIGQLKKLLETAPDETDLLSLLPKEEKKILVSSELPTQAPIEEGMPGTFKHSVNPGDLIGAMGSMKKYYDITKRKVVVAQSLDRRGEYYPGAVHPTTDQNGQQVTCNQYMFDMLKPLIESQDYISSFQKYEGQHIDVDLDVIRGKTFVNMPHGPITGWIALAYPDLDFDASKPWIELKGKCPDYVKKQVRRKVIVNFTERYREGTLDYFFLQNYAPDLIFAGTPKEHQLFCGKWQLNIPRLEIDNFLDLAYGLKKCRFVLGNQSMIWNICQAMQIPRVLEMFRFADNCFPSIGANSHGYFYQVAAEYYFRAMYNKTA